MQFIGALSGEHTLTPIHTKPKWQHGWTGHRDALTNFPWLIHGDRKTGVSGGFSYDCTKRQTYILTLLCSNKFRVIGAVMFCHSIPVIGTYGESLFNDVKETIKFSISETMASQHHEIKGELSELTEWRQDFDYVFFCVNVICNLWWLVIKALLLNKICVIYKIIV